MDSHYYNTIHLILKVNGKKEGNEEDTIHKQLYNSIPGLHNSDNNYFLH